MITQHELYMRIDKIIDELIKQFLDVKELNPFWNVAPYFFETITFSPSCDDYQNGSSMLNIKDSPYFPDNNITIDEVEDNEDLRTIAHLGKFFKNRVAYDPKNMDRYLWSLGILPYSETAFDVVCYSVCDCSDVSKDIPYSLWRTLPDGKTPLIVTLTDKANLEQDWYIESFDTPSEYNERETPIR